MEAHSIPPDKRKVTKFRLLALGGTAVIFLLVGMIVSTRLDLTHRSLANAPINVGETGLFPVVERNGETESPFVSVVEQIEGAVVNVSARTEDQELPWWYHGGGYSASSGSGFFFREDGYVLTNAHVVKNAREITVRTASGYDYDAQLIGADPMTDLAVLKVEPQEEIVFIPFGDSEGIKVGDWAIAIGNPFPQQGLDRSVTVGVISAKGRNNLRFGEDTPTFQNYIQTDAAINPGNSGGPLLNLRGECIGVNAAISTPTGSSVGIGFAIPINLVRAVVPDLIASGKVSRGWLGVWLSNVTDRQAKRLGLQAVRGVIIDSVFAGSPADQAGIKRGDLIERFNNSEVQNVNQFMVLVSTVKGGAKVPVEVVRDGDHMKLSATVADREVFLASAPSGSGRQNISQNWLGMEVVTFTDEMARQAGIKFVSGLYVVRVYSGTPADRAAISEGTIITQINGQEIESVNDIRLVGRQLEESGQRIPLIVIEPDGTIARKVLRP